MAGKQVNIDIKTTANTAGVEQATNSLQKLGETTTTSLNVSNKEASRFGARMANVGNQLQDVAVQAQSGTSAITILAQQGPQLLGSFGPQGAIAGAVLAAGALILSTMIKTTEAAKKAAQDAWTAADEFAQKAKDAFKEAGGKEADEFISKQERIVRLTEASTQAEIDLAGQQRERIKAQGELIKSQEDLAIASIKYLEATGQITDAENRISEVRGEARESQKELAVADIEASVKPAEIRYKGILANLENAKEEKIRTEESIIQLQAEFSKVNREANIYRSGDKTAISEGRQPEGSVSLETSVLENQLAKLDAAVKSLQKDAEKAPEKIQSLIDEAGKAAQSLSLAQTSAQAQIDDLNQKFNSGEAAQKLNEGVTAITEGVKSLKADVDKLTPVNEQQAAVKDQLATSLADGKLTSDELLKNAAGLQLLQGTLGTSVNGQSAVIQEMQKVTNALIQSQNQLVAEAQRQAGLIKTLRGPSS